jgi:hypothetical protein
MTEKDDGFGEIDNEISEEDSLMSDESPKPNERKSMNTH